ncbi:hypothetical protein J6590_105330, partial [Homalodisca vitripennis]
VCTAFHVMPGFIGLYHDEEPHTDTISWFLSLLSLRHMTLATTRHCLHPAITAVVLSRPDCASRRSLHPSIPPPPYPLPSHSPCVPAILSTTPLHRSANVQSISLQSLIASTHNVHYQIVSNVISFIRIDLSAISCHPRAVYTTR